MIGIDVGRAGHTDEPGTPTAGADSKEDVTSNTDNSAEERARAARRLHDDAETVLGAER
jgi:hypothetical protein